MGPGHTVQVNRGWKQFEMHMEEVLYKFSVISYCSEHGGIEYKGKLTLQNSVMVLMD